MSARRTAHLLRTEPRLFLRKAWQRLKLWRGYAGAARRALAGAKAGPAELPGNTDIEDRDILPLLAGSVPVVILERRRHFVACGVRAVDVPVLLANIMTRLPQARPLVDGKPASLRLADLLRETVRAKSISFCTSSNADRIVWQFSIYDPEETGTHVSRRGSDVIGSVLYDGLLDRPGVTDLTLHMPELSRHTNTLPIDIVYAWVDSKDPAWKKAFAETRPPDLADGSDTIADSRFHSSGELRYSLRSVVMHLPWFSTIHIVSNCSPPAWLDPDHPQLRWVRHEEMLDRACLPTFNSHAIEASLHRIPGVTENFLYFNDDVFALDALTPAEFVNENGTLNANLEPKAVVNSEADPKAPDYLNAARNGAKLLYQRYGYYPTRLHMHAPHSLKRSLLEQLEAEFEQALDMTRRARFRSITDLSVASFLAHHYGFVRREVVYAGYPTEFVTSSAPFFALNMRRIAGAAVKPKIVCLNETGTPSRRWRRELVRFMTQQFPVSAPWERDV